MPRARRLIAAAAFDPDTLKALGHLFDEVWASMRPDVGDDPNEIETARMDLATIIIDLAKIRQLSDLEMARTAARLIREKSQRSGGVPSKQET